MNLKRTIENCFLPMKKEHGKSVDGDLTQVLKLGHSYITIALSQCCFHANFIIIVVNIITRITIETIIIVLLQKQYY